MNEMDSRTGSGRRFADQRRTVLGDDMNWIVWRMDDAITTMTDRSDYSSTGLLPL